MAKVYKDGKLVTLVNINKVENPDGGEISIMNDAYIIIDSEDGSAIVTLDVNSVGKIIADNLEPQNIKKGVTILGVTGTYEGE